MASGRTVETTSSSSVWRDRRLSAPLLVRRLRSAGQRSARVAPPTVLEKTESQPKPRILACTLWTPSSDNSLHIQQDQAASRKPQPAPGRGPSPGRSCPSCAVWPSSSWRSRPHRLRPTGIRLSDCPASPATRWRWPGPDIQLGLGPVSLCSPRWHTGGHK